MKNLLSEGRYDKVTTELSREIVDTIKRGNKRLQTRIVLFKRTYVEVSVYIHYSDELEPEVYGAMYPKASEIRKHYKGMKIIYHVNVPLDPERRMRGLSDLIPEIKNIVRHEIEHVTQSKFKERERTGFFSNKRKYPEDIEYWEYLTEPYEVEAYVRGLYKKAKTLRQPLNVLLNAWWQYLESVEVHPDELRQVKKAWIDYAKKHLPQTPLRQYGYIEEPHEEVAQPPINYINTPEDITESQRVMGFKYKKPAVNVIVSIEASDSGNIRFKLMDLLDRMDVSYNSVTGGGGRHNSYTLDLNLYDEKEAQAIINDLNIKLMLDNIRITHSNHHVKEATVVSEAALFEAKKDTLRSKWSHVNEEDFNRLVDSDPSPTKKYADWMLKTHIDGGYSVDQIIPIILKFDQVNGRITHELVRKGVDAFENEIGVDIPVSDIDTIFRSPKDINSYKGLGILKAIINQVESKKTKKEEKLQGAEKIYEDENFLVILPKTKEGSCHYGSGTRWCVAARESNQFDNYSKRGTLYYIIFKANTALTPERRNKPIWQARLPKYEKIARFIPNGLDYGAHGEFYDAQDSQIEEDTILNGLFGVGWRYLEGLGEHVQEIPKGSQAFYDSFYKAWTRIDTHYAKNGMQKSRNSHDDYWDDDDFDEEIDLGWED